MMATDRLCRMLDELGVEYVSIGGITNWEHAEFDELADGSDTRLIVLEATPEQAIAATVGMGTCRNISDPPSGFLCSECGWGDFNEPTHLLKDAKHCPNCGARLVGE